MKRLETIIKNINEDKSLTNRIDEQGYYNIDDFMRDAKSYIKAIKESSMICVINSVSRSGMSRNLAFYSVTKSKNRYNTRQYYNLFRALDYNRARNSRNYFIIHGCGMDMVFNTNYEIIHKLCRLGFISNKQCAKLAQETPNVL